MNSVHSSSFTVEDVNDFISKSFENISPIKYQVNKTKVDELASSSVKCLILTNFRALAQKNPFVREN